MSRLDERMEQETLEKGISGILSHFQTLSERLDAMMQPKLAACSSKEQTITIEYPVLEWQLNYRDMMHGGAIVTAFDNTFGILAHHLNDMHTVVTVSLTVNYIKPIPKGDSILVTAKATSLGKKLITVTGECRLKSSGLLTNTATGIFAIV
ncbi:MAG TPA: PaaI family thioesterase [Anaerovoracaceae bacterium]|nr:PaaI family thioesterase [Anaerovoracaceae bacterium]